MPQSLGMMVLEYEVLEEDPTDFTSGKKVSFERKIVYNGQTVDEAIIASGRGWCGPGKKGFFLYDDSGFEEGKSWNLKFEAGSEEMLLLRLASLAENLEVEVHST